MRNHVHLNTGLHEWLNIDCYARGLKPQGWVEILSQMMAVRDKTISLLESRWHFAISFARFPFWKCLQMSVFLSNLYAYVYYHPSQTSHIMFNIPYIFIVLLVVYIDQSILYSVSIDSLEGWETFPLELIFITLFCIWCVTAICGTYPDYTMKSIKFMS